jgi:hypothetical protein
MSTRVVGEAIDRPAYGFKPVPPQFMRTDTMTRTMSTRACLEAANRALRVRGDSASTSLGRGSGRSMRSSLKEPVKLLSGLR